MKKIKASHYWPLLLFLLTSPLLLAACSEEQEASKIERTVVDGVLPAPFKTEQGYTVTFTKAKIGVKDFTFEVAGEAHLTGGKDNLDLKHEDFALRSTNIFSESKNRFLSLFNTISDALIPSAHAHPGHSLHGEVTGELKGSFNIVIGEKVKEHGKATLLPGKYTAGNFDLVPLTNDDKLKNNQSIYLEGKAEKNNKTIKFYLAFEAPARDTRIEGVPVKGDTNVTKNSNGKISFQFVPEATEYVYSLFSQIDFSAFADSNNEINWITPLPLEKLGTPEYKAYYKILSGMHTHNYFQLTFSN